MRDAPIFVGFLFLGDKDLGTAHVRTKHLGDSYATIRLKMILKECDKHTRRCDDCIIEGMRQIHSAVGALYAHSEAASLCISEVGAGADLKIFLLSG